MPPVLDFQPQGCEELHVCCFKAPSWWYFVWVALESNHLVLLLDSNFNVQHSEEAPDQLWEVSPEKAISEFSPRRNMEALRECTCEWKQT